jgi:hypothetical protein
MKMILPSCVFMSDYKQCFMPVCSLTEKSLYIKM